MSPRKVDPRVRSLLVEVAARILTEEGPQALSARRVAGEAGISTMPVYTHFNGMSGLVREIVHEGFARMQSSFSLVRRSDDPVTDMAVLGRAYRQNALANPHLYAVMFGGSSLASFELSEADRQHGRYTLSSVIECAKRCIAAERFTVTDPELVAHQMWSATHGVVTLELGGYLVPPYDSDSCFERQLIGLMVGAGDTFAAATRSVEVSRLLYRGEPASSRPGQAAGDAPGHRAQACG
ncbi:MAG TPA: TetR/AcrR family transcriptional regulator [Streptosporangiaceae bacterium]|nr:TetR/AcrR family transcriptional regulator [Streptosporangiaceae bacterium]